MERKIIEAAKYGDDLFFFIDDNLIDLMDNSDKYRKYFCSTPRLAFYYAMKVDKKPTWDTFKVIANTNFETLYWMSFEK